MPNRTPFLVPSTFIAHFSSGLGCSLCQSNDPWLYCEAVRHKTSHKREDVITTHVKTTFSRYFKCNAVDKYLSKLLDDLWWRESAAAVDGKWRPQPNREVGFIIHNLKTASGDKYTSFTFQFTPCHLSGPVIGAHRHFSPNKTRANAEPGRACTRVVSALVLPPGRCGKIRQFCDFVEVCNLWSRPRSLLRV